MFVGSYGAARAPGNTRLSAAGGPGKGSRNAERPSTQLAPAARATSSVGVRQVRDSTGACPISSRCPIARSAS